jgi:uncharacterized protein YbbK (DUF523 family)
MGFPCRYNAQIQEHAALYDALSRHAVPVCPETLGGLGVPRPPSEIRGGTGAEVLLGSARVLNTLGEDVTLQYVRGARLALAIGLQAGCRIALLKARSPGCGARVVYDGTFSGTLRPGDGVLAALLSAHGFRLYTEDEFEEALLSQSGEKQNGAEGGI